MAEKETTEGRNKMTKKILITGGCGFLGHHFLEHLLKNTEWDITLLDRLSYSGSLEFITDVPVYWGNLDRVHFIYHDFRAELHPEQFDHNEYNYIVHLGAETDVYSSIKTPKVFIDSNIIGTYNMLEYARKVQPDKFIQVSTDETVGSVKRVDGKLQLNKEDAPHRPSNPYSSSKAAAEDLCYAWRDTYNVPVITTRCMNMFAERQNREKFIPKTVRAMLLGEKVPIHVRQDVSGNVVDISSRFWLHARNHADALMFLLEHGDIGETYHIVGEWADVESVANIIGETLGIPPEKRNIYYENCNDPRPGHDMHYGLDGTKLKEMGWKPPMEFLPSLKKTVLWMRDNKRWLNL